MAKRRLKKGVRQAVQRAAGRSRRTRPLRQPERPTVCLVYCLGAGEQAFLQRSLEAMLDYGWVSQAVVLHSWQDGPEQQAGPVRHVRKDFGQGIDRPLEEGGWDQVAARNYSLGLGVASGCQWLLLLDADEVFTADTYERTILPAHRQNKLCCWYECWHCVSPWQHVMGKRPRICQVGPRRQALHDPHPRLVRADSGVRHIAHPPQPGKLNPTQHCCLSHVPIHRDMAAPGVFHLHTRYMFDPKRPPWTRQRPWVVPPCSQLHDLPGDSPFPNNFIAAWRRQEGARS